MLVYPSVRIFEISMLTLTNCLLVCFIIVKKDKENFASVKKCLEIIRSWHLTFMSPSLKRAYSKKLNVNKEK